MGPTGASLAVPRQVAELLLQANADVSACAQDNKGNSALHWASSRNACGAARVLLKYNARVDLENKDGKTPLTMEMAGAEVLKILKGEDAGAASDPARPAPMASLPVSNTHDTKPASSDAQATGQASCDAGAPAPTASSGAPHVEAPAPSAAGKGLGGGGKGLASAPGSRPANDDDDDSVEEGEDDSDEEGEDKEEGGDSADAEGAGTSASQGGDSGAPPAAEADDDEDDESDSEEDD